MRLGDRSHARTRKAAIRVCALAGAVSVTMFGATVSAGAQSAEDKRAQAQAIIAAVQRLDDEVGAAAERWSGAKPRARVADRRAPGDPKGTGSREAPLRGVAEGRLAEREQLLGSVKDEIVRLEEAERRRQGELQRQAAAELERQRRAADAQAQSQARQAAEPQPPSTSPPSSGGRADSLTPTLPDYVPPPADASRGAQVVAIAMQYLGIPYRWGGASPETGSTAPDLHVRLR